MLAPTPPKRIVLLLDESAAMQAVVHDRVADGGTATKTNAERIAAAVNGLLRRLGDGDTCEIALVGYGSDKEGHHDVGCRWRGELAGREFVLSRELGAAAKIEKRVRKLSRPDGSVTDETLDFPVWYEPKKCALAPQAAGLKFVADLLARRNADGAAGRTIVIHVFGGESSDGSPQIIADELGRMDCGGDKPFIVQCHVASAASQITSAFPVQQALLPAGLARDLFSRASPVPEPLRTAAAQAQIVIQPGARAALHNAKLVEVVRCLELARLYGGDFAAQAAQGPTEASSSIQPQSSVGVEAQPPAGAGTEPAGSTVSRSGEKAALAVIVLDRYLGEEPSAAETMNFSPLQEAANEILRQLSAKPCTELPIDVAIVSYGAGSDGQADVRTTFNGPLAGRDYVRTVELSDGAIRVDEKTVEMSNGAGGILSFTRRTPIHFDLPATTACPPQHAFAAVAAIIAKWCAAHLKGCAPVVLHLTRASYEVSDVKAAAELLAGLQTDGGALRLQHSVLPVSPHPSCLYPAIDDEIGDETMRALWGLSSPLIDWEKLRGTKRSYISAGARAFVVNGSFDTLAEELAIAVASSQD